MGSSSTEKGSMAHVLLNSIRKYSVQGNTIKDQTIKLKFCKNNNYDDFKKGN